MSLNTHNIKVNKHLITFLQCRNYSYYRLSRNVWCNSPSIIVTCTYLKSCSGKCAVLDFSCFMNVSPQAAWILHRTVFRMYCWTSIWIILCNIISYSTNKKWLFSWALQSLLAFEGCLWLCGNSTFSNLPVISEPYSTLYQIF